MKPSECSNALKLKRDNWSYGDYWILTDGATVTVCHQKLRNPPEESCSIPRDVFNRLIRWYERDQKDTP